MDSVTRALYLSATMVLRFVTAALTAVVRGLTVMVSGDGGGEERFDGGAARTPGDELGRGGRELDSRSNRAIDAAERKANRQVSRVRGVARGVRHRHNLAHAETVL